MQVNFLNKALAEYDASVVVPTHYVIFTLASICAPSVLYQELTFDNTLLKVGLLPRDPLHLTRRPPFLSATRLSVDTVDPGVW